MADAVQCRAEDFRCDCMWLPRHGQNVSQFSGLLVAVVYARLLHICACIEPRPLDSRRNKERFTNKHFGRLPEGMRECELLAEGILDLCRPGALCLYPCGVIFCESNTAEPE